MGECQWCRGTGREPAWGKLGAKLRKRRVKAGRSLRGVAREIGCSAAHLSDMEKGRRAMGGEYGRAVLAMFDLDVEEAFR